ncbi:hypothetical protein B14_200165 (plasmid) [Bacillus licheniformis]|mgnify:FL=1|uniref:hypothetical protein n=1 Tax=Bacillus subtilis group TaxID=653685 RepID=UPI0009B7E2C2|nr:MULTISPECIES: hypothetical protein [Bacillus subtilis group]ARC67376.1 hypothetical protein B14_200165 [Bacillus licheniformis]ARW46215.1 hypothetical protein S100141_04997 [Bacillus licheniformis]MDE1421807.1 hypothetical protein [Bacillus licheniformis]PLC14044.1 hypothetical protein BV582_20960 [Bacillus paralicheniformis]QAS18649.1 hypothetical protein EQJ69_22240 [Bacillus licheniformis]
MELITEYCRIREEQNKKFSIHNWLKEMRQKSEKLPFLMPRGSAKTDMNYARTFEPMLLGEDFLRRDNMHFDNITRMIEERRTLLIQRALEKVYNQNVQGIKEDLFTDFDERVREREEM